LICLAGQPDLFGITNSDVAVAGADRVVGAVLALPAVLDQQTVVGVYAHLGELTQQPAAESPEQDSLAVKSLTLKPAAGGQPVAGRRPVAGPPWSGQTGDRRGPRQAAHGTGRGVRIGTDSGGSGRARKSKAQHHGASGMTRLMFLAAFVVFAVYVLPYWGR
jgi:hypothetical protein